MASKMKSWLTLILKIAVAAGLIVYMVKGGHLDLSQLWSLMTFKNVAVAVILCGVITLFAVWRWVVLLHARGLYIPFGYGVSLYLIGMFFSYALPGSVSGDLIRGYYLVQDYPGRKMDSVLSVLIDRVLGLYSFFLFTLIAVAWDFDFVMSHEQIRWVALLCLFIFLGMTGFFLLSFSTRLYKMSGLGYLVKRIAPLHKVMEGFQRFGKDRRIIAISLGASLLAQLLTMVFFYQIAVIMGETDITWKAVFFAVPMGFVMTAVPIAPAGVGVGQVAFLYLFQTYVGHPTGFGATAITAYQLTVALYAIIGALFYLRRRKNIPTP